jgi:hypothetical protein
MPNQGVVIAARVLLAMFAGGTRAGPQRRFYAADQARLHLAREFDPWADRTMARYGITRIRLNVEGTHIYAVEYRGIVPGRYARRQVGPAIQIARLGMIDIVRRPGNRVITLPRDAYGNYNMGQPVFIKVGPDGIEYLESLADGIEGNNLRALPTF